MIADDPLGRYRVQHDGFESALRATRSLCPQSPMEAWPGRETAPASDSRANVTRSSWAGRGGLSKQPAPRESGTWAVRPVGAQAAAVIEPEASHRPGASPPPGAVPVAGAPLDPFERGYLVGLLVGEGHFGGDGRQPQVTLRMHARHEALFRWLVAAVPGARLYGPYHHGGRHYYQWMVRGAALREHLWPLLLDALPLLDGHVRSRLLGMATRYGLPLGDLDEEG